MNAHQATLIAPLTKIFDALEDDAVQNGGETARSADALSIKTLLGHVTLKRGTHQTVVDFAAASLPELQTLKDRYAEKFTKFCLDDGISWEGKSGRSPLNQLICTVVSSHKISDNFQRIRLSGDFSAYQDTKAGLHFRLLLGDMENDWPYLDENGLTVWPNGVGAWHRPPYTVRRLSPDADWMDVDIVLHSGGRVTEWSKHAKIGEVVAIHGPGGSKRPAASWLKLVGDETALPVIMRIIEELPSGIKCQAVIGVRDRSDIQPYDKIGDIELIWADLNEPDILEKHIRTGALPDTDRFVFFAGEVTQAAKVRKIFKEMGLSSTEAKAVGYWAHKK